MRKCSFTGLNAGKCGQSSTVSWGTGAQLPSVSVGIWSISFPQDLGPSGTVQPEVLSYHASRHPILDRGRIQLTLGIFPSSMYSSPRSLGT